MLLTSRYSAWKHKRRTLFYCYHSVAQDSQLKTMKLNASSQPKTVACYLQAMRPYSVIAHLGMKNDDAVVQHEIRNL